MQNKIFTKLQTWVKCVKYLGIAGMSIIFLASCQKSENVRQYSEMATQETGGGEALSILPDSKEDKPLAKSAPPTADDPHAFMKDKKNDPHAGYTKEELQEILKQQGISVNVNMNQSRPLTWETPEGWVEKPATGMRIATLVLKSQPNAFDCSIVSLGGGAGGLEPNVIRWMEQISLKSPGDKDLKEFIQSQERVKLANNLIAILFDFTVFQKNMPDNTPSMVASIIDTPSQRIFVKMTGQKDEIINNLKSYKSLVQSIHINSN